MPRRRFLRKQLLSIWTLFATTLSNGSEIDVLTFIESLLSLKTILGRKLIFKILD